MIGEQPEVHGEMGQGKKWSKGGTFKNITNYSSLVVLGQVLVEVLRLEHEADWKRRK